MTVRVTQAAIPMAQRYVELFETSLVLMTASEFGEVVTGGSSRTEEAAGGSPMAEEGTGEDGRMGDAAEDAMVEGKAGAGREWC